MTPSLTAVLEEAALAALLGGPARQKRGTSLSLSALTGFCVITGAVFLGIALDHHLETLYTPALAAAYTGLAAFTAGLLAFAVKKWSQPPPPPPLPISTEDLRQHLRSLIEDVCGDIEGPVRDNPKSAMFLAALGGFLAAETHRR